MTTIGQISSTLEQFTPYASSGTPACALASRDQMNLQESLWHAVLDELLKWLNSADELFDLEDRPSPDVIKAAIDFVVDQTSGVRDEIEVVAPTLIAPSGNGRIVMEWRLGAVWQSVEFLGPGEGEMNIFDGGKLIATALLRRNPRSRWEEQVAQK